jgi:hypothetical protein
MPLDETAKITNVRKSFKKFMVDNLYGVEHIRISFDMDITPPVIQGVPAETWIAVNYGTSTPETISSQMINLVLCTRKDTEGQDLDQLRDTVMGYLTDTSRPHGLKNIPLYDVMSLPPPWTQVGSMLVYLDAESGQQRADDGTKFWIISITLKWGSKI